MKEEEAAAMEPRLCVFKVSIASAENVWPADTSTEGSKAAVSVHFPGEEEDGLSSSSFCDPVSPRNDSSSSPEIPLETSGNKKKIKGKPDQALNPKTKSTPSPSSNANDKSDPKLDPTINTEPSPSPSPNPSVVSPSVSFVFGALSEYVRPSGLVLWHNLVTEPLVVSLQWVSPSGRAQAIIGKACIDLSELLFSENLVLERDFELQLIQPDIPAKLPNAKKDQKNASSAPSKGKKGNNAEEIPPLLLPGAFMKVQISIDIPILSEEERKGGMILEFTDFCVKKIPPQYAEMASNNLSFSMAFEMPGFIGSWWESIPDLNQGVKEKIAVARIHGGLVSLKGANEGGLLSNGKDSVSSSSNEKVEATQLEVRKEIDDTKGATTQLEIMKDPDGSRSDSDASSQPQMEPVITWNASIKRFLPSMGVLELRERIWKKQTWHGEIARYSSSEPTTFQRDHLTVSIDLSSLLQEGAFETCISSVVNLYTQKKELLSENGEGKISGSDDDNGMANPWKSCCPQLSIHVSTSRPLKPVWVPPLKPTVNLKDVLTVRPKLPTFDERSKIAVDEFRALVKAAAESIMSLQEKVISDNASDFNSTTLWSNRAEHNEKLRIKLSTELHKMGTWHNLKEEMKGRVLKIASEKFKLANEETKDNFFVFYNSLYVQLMKVIKESTEDLNSMRREAFLNFSEGLETGASKRLHTSEHLRQLANEYEADGDYLSANRCYEEILSENKLSSDHWLEYGLFCMRGKYKELGKAEECFRESINIEENHVSSLLALACLLWHRSFYLQAEVLLHRIIELHPKEEAIAWVLLGQIYISTGEQTDNNQMDKANSCFTQAENLHSSSNNRSSTILSSSFLKHAFSLSYPIHQSCIPSNAYIDAALLLLDLHFPKEAQTILTLEHASFSCDIGFKLCLARTKQLFSDYNEAENLIKEVVTSYAGEGVADTAWMLLGHIHYLSASFQQAIDAYEQMRRYHDGEQHSHMFGLLELGKSYLHEHHLDKAKGIIVDICAKNPSSSSWLVAGMVFYKEGDMESAQAALEEGNVLDPWNFKIWAYLTLVSLTTNQVEEAKFAFKQALNCTVFPPLLVDIAEAFHSKGDSRLAEMAFQKLCEGKNGALISRLAWETGSWNQKVSFAKQLAKALQENPEVYGVSSDYDPLREVLETREFQLNIPSVDDNDGSQGTPLKELQALACT